MNLYKHHSDREVVAVLSHTGKLTYEAQLNLRNELQKRQLAIDTEELEQQIQEKEMAIKNLEHLKDLGFVASVDEIQGQLTLQRTKLAQVMDGVSAVLGLVLTLVGLVTFFLVLRMFFGNNEFSLSKLILYGLLILVGLTGFKMLSGAHRFLDYRKFLLAQQGDTLSLHIKSKTTTYTASEASLVTIEEDLILMLGDQEVLYASAQNLKQRLTLEELLHKIKRIG